MPTFTAIAAIVTLATMIACSTFTAEDDNDRQIPLPTPYRSQVQIIDPDTPPGLTDPATVSAYQRAYSHMRSATWLSAIAAYGEAVRIQPYVAGLYEARGTAYLYAGQHDETLTDYSLAIELDPADSGLWRRRAHAHKIAPTPQPERGVQDATRAIELDPTHHMGYGHESIALTQLPTPDRQNPLADMDRRIELFPGHDPEAYEMRALIHDNLGNHQEAERDRQLAQ